MSSCASCARFRGPFAKYRTYAHLLTRRGLGAYKQNELNADKIRSMGEILDYEAIIQYTGLKDNDLLYFSYTNQARAGTCWHCPHPCGDLRPRTLSTPFDFRGAAAAK